VSDAGVRANVSVALRYLESWLRGVGAAALDNLMEDVATAEISRSQLWHWIRQGVVTSEGTVITREYVAELLGEVLDSVAREDGDRYGDAAQVVRDVTLGEGFPEFLTFRAYDRFLVSASVRASAV
jgi:malate synthase